MDAKTVNLQLSEGEVIWLCNRRHVLYDLSQTSFLESAYIQRQEELFSCRQHELQKCVALCYTKLSCLTWLKIQEPPQT